MKIFPDKGWRIAALLALAAGALAGARAQTAAGDPVDAELGKRWRSLRTPKTETGVRDLMGFVLEATGVGWHPEFVERALATVRDMQDLDGTSKTYGNFRWTYGQTAVLDPNAVEFCLQQAALVRMQHFDRLSPRGQHLLQELLTTGLKGVAHHRVQVAYTNIFLMKAWNLIALGETLERPAQADEGYRMLDEWMRFTAQNGIAEYLSPNYYGVDLDSLALIAKFAGRAEGRAQAQTALRLFWSDIAANWYAPAERLGGANSRCYQYLEGRGDLDKHLAAAGWLTAAQPPVLKIFADACRWNPSSELTEPLVSTVPRTVVRRWGVEPWRRATHYIGHAFSLGSAGAFYNSDDRALVLNVGRSRQVPEIILFMDGRGDPYGATKTLDRSRHAKALHLTPFIATVQRGPEVVQVLAEDLARPGTRRPADTFTGLYTQLPIPAQAEVWWGEQRAEPGPPDRPVVVPPDSPVFVRLDDVVVGVRFLCTMGTDDGAARVVYVQDKPDLPAKRLTVVQAEGTPTGRGMTAVWLRVAEGLDHDGFAAFRRNFGAAEARVSRTGDVLAIEAAGLESTLRLEVDLKKNERRRLDGGEPGTDTALLMVNRRDVGREMLAAYGAR